MASRGRWIVGGALALWLGTLGRGHAADEVTMFRYDAGHSGALAGAPMALGGLAWRFATGGKVRSTPAVAAGLAVFGSEDGQVYAVELKTGALIWKVKLGSDVSCSPAIARGRVVVAARDGSVRALNLEDGGVLWTFAMGADIPAGADPRLFDMWISSPTIEGNTVFLGGGDGRVYAIDLASGKPRWSHATEHRVRSSPAVKDGAVFVGSFDGHVYALDAATGAERWAFDTGGPVQASPAVWEDVVIVGSRSMAIFGLDVQTGQPRWRRPHSGSWILASAAVFGGLAIVGGSDSHLIEALNARTGQPFWTIPVGARVLGSPTVMGGVVLFGAEDFRVYTADLQTGLGLSMEFTEGPIYTSLVPAGELALAGSDDHCLYAFKLVPAAPAPDSAPLSLLESAVGVYALDSGDVYKLSIYKGRLSLAYCNYPPSLVSVKADGSFSSPMTFGLRGRLRREADGSISSLLLAADAGEVTARRLK